MKRVFITGVAGFISSHLAERLLELGYYVLGVDNLSAGKRENMKTFINHPNFKFYQYDVTNYGLIKQIFINIDVVFHLAASKKTICLKDPMRDLEVNAKGTYNMLLLSEHFGVEKFIHSSTGSVYGESNGQIQDENFHISPCSFYGISKFAGERYVNLFNKHRGLDTTILRYHHVVGKRQDSGSNGGVIAIFTEKLKRNEPVNIFGDGTQMRYFTHVSDVVEANIQSMLNPASSGETYNVASNEPITLIEATNKLKAKFNSESEILYKDWTVGDIKYFNVCNNKIKDSLNIDFIPFSESVNRL